MIYRVLWKGRAGVFRFNSLIFVISIQGYFIHEKMSWGVLWCVASTEAHVNAFVQVELTQGIFNVFFSLKDKYIRNVNQIAFVSVGESVQARVLPRNLGRNGNPNLDSKKYVRPVCVNQRAGWLGEVCASSLMREKCCDHSFFAWLRSQRQLLWSSC